MFPHFVLDRGKPGLIAVDSSGRRFVNEAIPYHRFGQAIYAAHAIRPTIPCFFVCDHRFLLAYGLGMVRPRGLGVRAALADGYLTRARRVAGLAGALGIDAAALQATVERNNALRRGRASMPTSARAAMPTSATSATRATAPIPASARSSGRRSTPSGSIRATSARASVS